MPMKQAGRKTYKSLQGKLIDMDMLRQRNELTPAVGNVRVNARGDELGPGGKIVRKREEILAEYYESTKGVPNEPIPTASKTPLNTEEPTQQKKSKAKTKTTENWVEDTDGNFVPKED